LGDGERSFGDTPNPGSILLHRDGVGLYGRIAAHPIGRPSDFRQEPLLHFSELHSTLGVKLMALEMKQLDTRLALRAIITPGVIQEA
jgi:hypothetical protein